MVSVAQVAPNFKHKPIRTGDPVPPTEGSDAHPVSWAEFLNAVLEALPYQAQISDSGDRTYYRLPDAICCDSGNHQGLHLFIDPTGGLGARCWSNGIQISGAGEDACTYWKIISRLEDLTGVRAPRQVTAHKRPTDQAKGPVYLPKSGLRWPTKALAWALLVTPQPGGFFTGADFNLQVGELMNQACRKADVWCREWTLKSCRPAALSLASVGSEWAGQIHLPTSEKRGATRGYWGYALRPVDANMVKQMADALTEEREQGRPRRPRRDSSLKVPQLTARDLGINPRSTRSNPRALRTHPRERHHQTEPPTTTTINNSASPVLATFSASTTHNSNEVPTGHPFKNGVVRGNRASPLENTALRATRLVQEAGLSVPSGRVVDHQLHPGPLEEGIAIPVAQGRPTADPGKPLWRYRKAGTARWHVSVQLPLHEERRPERGDAIQVLTKAGEVHHRMLDRQVEERSYGWKGTRRTFSVRPDEMVATRAAQRRAVHAWNWLWARATGNSPDWQPLQARGARYWPLATEISPQERERQALKPVAGSDTVPHQVILPPRTPWDPEVSFRDLLAVPRWLLMGAEGNPLRRGLPDGGWVQPTSATPHLWRDAQALEREGGPPGSIAAYCLRQVAGQGDESPPLPAVAILDIDYKPAGDADGLGRALRDAWFDALRVYPQSMSRSGNGRHVLVAVHPDDGPLWERLRGRRIKGPDGSGVGIDLFAPGSGGYVGITRQWVGMRGDSLNRDGAEAIPIPVLRARQLVELPGAADIREVLR